MRNIGLVAGFFGFRCAYENNMGNQEKPGNKEKLLALSAAVR